jgi:hypothetical protein
MVGAFMSAMTIRTITIAKNVMTAANVRLDLGSIAFVSIVAMRHLHSFSQKDEISTSFPVLGKEAIKVRKNLLTRQRGLCFILCLRKSLIYSLVAQEDTIQGL